MNISVLDPSDEALYPEIVTFEKGDVFDLTLTQFNNATSGDDYFDLSNVDLSFRLTTGSMRVVFLNSYIHTVLVRTALYASSTPYWYVQHFTLHPHRTATYIYTYSTAR